MNNHMSIHAHPRYLIATDAASLLVAEVILFALSRIRLLFSPLAYLLLGLGVLIGFAADVGLWFWKGVRALELTDELLTVFRGPALSPETVQRSVILRARISRLPGSRSVRLRTMSGRRLRITENAFQRDEYTRFLAALQGWVPPQALK